MGKTNSFLLQNVKMRCPECLNFMNAKRNISGTISGTCPVCKSKIFSKQYSNKERHIKIVKSN